MYYPRLRDLREDKDLKQADHESSADIFKSLYEWKATVIAVNISKNDNSTYRSSLSKSDPIFFTSNYPASSPEMRRVLPLR